MTKKAAVLDVALDMPEEVASKAAAKRVEIFLGAVYGLRSQTNLNDLTGFGLRFWSRVFQSRHVKDHM